MNSKTCCSIVLQVVSQQNQVFLTIEIFISLGLRARVLFIPTSYPGPLGQMGPSRKTYSSQVHLDTGVAVAQRATGPLVILSPPAVCKLLVVTGFVLDPTGLSWDPTGPVWNPTGPCSIGQALQGGATYCWPFGHPLAAGCL